MHQEVPSFRFGGVLLDQYLRVLVRGIVTLVIVDDLH